MLDVYIFEVFGMIFVTMFFLGDGKRVWWVKLANDV